MKRPPGGVSRLILASLFALWYRASSAIATCGSLHGLFCMEQSRDITPLTIASP